MPLPTQPSGVTGDQPTSSTCRQRQGPAGRNGVATTTKSKHPLTQTLGGAYDLGFGPGGRDTDAATAVEPLDVLFAASQINPRNDRKEYAALIPQMDCEDTQSELRQRLKQDGDEGLRKSGTAVEELVQGTQRFLRKMWMLLIADVAVSLHSLRTCAHTYPAWMHDKVGFAPVPTPSSRQMFLDWTILMPWLLAATTINLNMCVLCWSFNADSSTLALSTGLGLLLALHLVMRAPQEIRRVCSWMFFHDHHDKPHAFSPPVHMASPVESESSDVNYPTPELLGKNDGEADILPISQLHVAGLTVNRHSIWTFTITVLYAVCAFFLVPKAQFPLPWFNSMSV
jgi:hypothetical protein